VTKVRHSTENMVGRSIFLSPPTYEDASEGPWYSWFNDPEATRFTSHGQVVNTREDQIIFYENTIGDESRRVFAICDRESGEMVGVTSLQDIDLENRTAEIAIMIGNSRFRGQGVSLETWGLLAQYGFQNLQIDKLVAGSHEKLRRWVESLSAIGFQIESEQLNYFLDDDPPAGVIWYACHRTKFERLMKKNGLFDADVWLHAQLDQN
jgi:ribosomal-protein-alanine N-acetyltransferase